MKACKAWSYAPYTPPFFEGGALYICRIAPGETSVRLEWLGACADYTVFGRERGTDTFMPMGTTCENGLTVTGLKPDTDYEWYVAAGHQKSRIRLARCGAIPDTIVNYLHPEDEAYAFSGRFLCSPSLVRHPEGYLLASMDLYAPKAPQNLTLLYRSDDDGKTWQYVSELFPCFWGKLFVHQNALFMLACSTEYGDLLISRSTDGGKTFATPTVLLRGSNGKNGQAGWHKNPQPVVICNGRIWNTLEYGSWGQKYHAAAVMSAPEDADLLNPESWLFSEPLKYDPNWPSVPEGESTGNIEGCLVEKEGRLWNVMRYDMRKMTPNYGYVVAYGVNTNDPEASLCYDRCIPFPANHAKFEIKFDPKTKKYYSIVSRITDSEHHMARNLLSLMVSDDLEHWEVAKDILDYTHCDPKRVGFQYVDFLIEGDHILYLCRTAVNGADSYHNSNAITFGRIALTTL